VSIAPGVRLGDYSVVGLLGSGGMGEVYRAHDARLGRDVAIKVLPSGLLQDGDARARFKREARAVAALNHPHIVTIHEIGEDETRLYIAFELVDGITLRDRLAAGALAPADALALALQIARGLAHAHDAGVLHRDLKPRNIMIRPDGQVKILDFGLGKLLASSRLLLEATTSLPSEATAPGAILGTAGYSSPEQIKGAAVDARSDQFAFGALFYEMLTGQRAFDRGTVIQTLNAVVESDPPAIARLAPAVPAAMAQIAERCLAKDPDRRYPTTRDLVSALTQAGAAAGAPTNRLWRAATRRKAAVWLLGALAAVALGAISLAPRQTSGDRNAVDLPERRIVVLPFTSIGGDATGQAFADGMVELLTTNLSGLEAYDRTLLVVAATEVRREGIRSVRDARRAFGASFAVSGSVQRVADQIRLTLNLVDAATMEQRGGRIMTGTTADVLALQDASVLSLAAMLDVELQRRLETPRRPGTPAAYDYYVQGRGYLQRFERLDSVDAAIELFTRALSADSRFALAHSGLGEAYWRKYELTKHPAFVQQAREQARRAADLDPDSPAVHFTRGMVARGTGEYETAATALQRVLVIEPSNADAFRELGRTYEALGEFAAAEATYLKGIQARPADWSGYGALGRFYVGRMRYEEALAQFQRVTELTPDNAAAYSNVGGVQYFLKRYDEAASAFEKSVAIRPTAAALSNLGTLYFDRERFTEAARVLERAVALNDNDYRVWGNLGSAYLWAGDEAKSRTAYQRAATLAEAELAVDSRRAIVLADAADFLQAIGQRDRAKTLAERAVAQAPADGRVLFKVAVAYEGLAERDRALSFLRRALDAGFPRQSIEQSRALARLRADPRFRQLTPP
jgi:serine/threonine-protein kinase